jgi:uncharacterized membrane protein YkoI
MTDLSSRIHGEFIWFCFTAGAETIPPDQHMKNKIIINGILAAALVALGGMGCATEKQEQAELQAQAKISREQAQQTALAKVPGGAIKDGELEEEKGQLIWSFDITVADSKDIKEVAVDALTGAVVSVETETPEDQAKEAAEDSAKEKHAAKNKEDKD